MPRWRAHPLRQPGASSARLAQGRRQGPWLRVANSASSVARIVEAYQSAGRTDLADKELAEIAILAEFLPAALSEDELDALVTEAIAATGATSPRDLGKVMGWLSPRTRGRADGKVLSGLVASRLAAADLATHDAAASH